MPKGLIVNNPEWEAKLKKETEKIFSEQAERKSFLQYQKADYKYWLAMPEWELFEGVCLLLGINPNQKILKHNSSLDLSTAIQKRWFIQGAMQRAGDLLYDLLKRMCVAGNLPSTKRNLQFIVKTADFIQVVHGLSGEGQILVELFPDEFAEFLKKIDTVEESKSIIVPLEKKKEPHRDRCESQCKEIALNLWKKDKKLTIVELYNHPEIIKFTTKQNGDRYVEKTFRRWVSNLCPDRNPGRRKK